MRVLHAALILVLTASLAGIARPADSFIVLSYHEIEDVVPKEETLGRTVVSHDNLKAQVAWLKQNGYHVISVQNLLDAKAGKGNRRGRPCCARMGWPRPCLSSGAWSGVTTATFPWTRLPGNGVGSRSWGDGTSAITPDNVFRDQPKAAVLKDLFALPVMP